MKKLDFCYIFKSCTISHQPFWLHQYLYFHEMCKRIVGTEQRLSTEAWSNIQLASFKIKKNGVSNSYFVKIKTFKLQTSKLLGNRRKNHISDVICNRFCFWEVQEEVLGHCSGQSISAPRTEGLSFYQWSVPVKNKQSGWKNVFINTPLNFLSLPVKFWKNSKCNSMKVC